MMLVIVKVIAYFFLWTLYSYSVHRLAHIPHKKNFLYKIHIVHHRVKYGDSNWPEFSNYFFWFGSFKASLDIWLTLTLPLIVLVFIDPVPGGILLGFHYVYEVFLAGKVVDHNPRIRGIITRWLSIGAYHLKHHDLYKCNYSFFITLWDHIFQTTDKKFLGVRGAKERRENLDERY
ncbi:sterol desaturase family protein [Paenibacillus sp. KS1]|uniref:sterol desaturase family protein n=1 Tax=Paenibacillus sp. KS1 TaxID=1849249 RepID=UPI000AE6C524|nr:sterol desaturase family protein [Paenibacillus sp. KS1]